LLASIILLLLAFAIVSRVPRGARAVAYVALSLRAFLSIASVVAEGGLIGANADAQAFFRVITNRANDTAEIDFGLSSFSVLGAPDSALAAHFISIVGAAWCLVLLARCWMLLMPRDVAGLRAVLILYAAMPSLATYQSYILREVWQSLATLLVLYASLSWNKRGWRPMTGLTLLLGFALGSSLHHALPLAMLGLVLLGILLASGETLGTFVRNPHKALGLLILGVAFFIAMLPLLNQNVRFISLTEGNLVDDAARFTAAAERVGNDAGAFYGQFADLRRPWTLPGAFGAYQLSPLPYQMRGIADVVLTLENAFRIFLLWNWWKGRRLAEPAERRIVDLVVAMWFFLELVWSIGTVNWGTASRHHAMGYSLVLVAGWASQRRRKLVDGQDQAKIGQVSAPSDERGR